MRLACIHCDTDGADGVTEIPPGWIDVIREIPLDQTPENRAAIAEAFESGDWWTHLGTCPTCAILERAEKAIAVADRIVRERTPPAPWRQTKGTCDETDR